MGFHLSVACPANGMRNGGWQASRARSRCSNARRALVRSRDASKSKARLKQLEARQKASKRVPLSLRLAQAGLSWTPRRFMVISVSLGFVVFVVLMLTGVGLLPSLGIAFAAGGGLPFWALSFLKKRREAKFLDDISRCRRRDRARHQGRPAVARQPQADRRQKRKSRCAANSAASSRRRRSAFRSAKLA